MKNILLTQLGFMIGSFISCNYLDCSVEQAIDLNIGLTIGYLLCYFQNKNKL